MGRCRERAIPRRLRRPWLRISIPSDNDRESQAAGWFSLLTDLVDFFLEGQFINRRKRQRQEQPNAPLQNRKRLAIRALHFLLRSFVRRPMHRRRIRNAPMRRHRLPRPDRANFLRRVVADGKNKIHLGSVKLGEFIPALAPQILDWDTGGFESRECLGPDRPRGMTSGAIGGKPTFTFGVKEGLSKNRARRVAGAEKQNVVVIFHIFSPFLIADQITDSTPIHNTPPPSPPAQTRS